MADQSGLPSFDSLQPDVPFDQLVDDSQKYGTSPELLKTAVEQGVSGLTGGLSKVVETHGIPPLGIPPITTPEAIQGREHANPITATGANIVGTGALIYGTGGLGGAALRAGAGAVARVGVGALEGSLLGGINQATDDWSQNKSLDGQKIAAAAGIGTLLGAGGGLLGEGLTAAFKPKPLAKVPGAVENQSIAAFEAAQNAAAPPVDAPSVKGVQPTTYGDIVERVKQAKANDDAVALPAQAELDEAASRVALENPVNPLQRDSLGSQQARDVYQTAKETPGEVGGTLSNYEGLQKQELVNKTEQGIRYLSPMKKPVADAYEGGKEAIDAFTEQYQAEKKALGPIFNDLKKSTVSADLLPDSVERMSQAVPGISNMFELKGNDLSIRPYKTAWGIDKATYSAVKEAVDSLQGEDHTLQTLWNVRKGLDQHVDVLAQGQAPQEIRSLKAALMTQMQDLSNNPEIREAFKRYAINEQQRQVIEKTFGASVGTPEFGQISKVKPELIGDKIFGNTATVEAAKNILPKEQFERILGNWLSENKAKVTDKGAFSANKWGSFLRRNQDALNIAFQERPQDLQNLKDLTTIMRILPDSASINPSGTAKTLSRMIPDLLETKVHNVTWEGLLLSLPKKVASEITKHIKMNELNELLSGQALKNSQTQSLKAQVEKISQRLDEGVKALFVGTSSQTRKANEKRK